MPPFKMHEIRELIRLIDESEIEQFELEIDGSKVMIKKAVGINAPFDSRGVSVSPSIPSHSEVPSIVPQVVEKEVSRTEVAPVKEIVEENQHLHKIVSPMVGTFYRASSPDSDPYVLEGDKVNNGSVVCIVEAMKLMNEIEAETTGKIVKILAENGQLVEYGQPLFLVEKV